jgi:hypothetical protein
VQPAHWYQFRREREKIRFQTCHRMGSLWAVDLVSKFIPQCKMLSSYLPSTKVILQNSSKSKQKVMSWLKTNFSLWTAFK